MKESELYTPMLAGRRRIVIAQLTNEQHQRLIVIGIVILHQALPLAQLPSKAESLGRGDWLFYRL